MRPSDLPLAGPLLGLVVGHWVASIPNDLPFLEEGPSRWDSSAAPDGPSGAG